MGRLIEEKFLEHMKQCELRYRRMEENQERISEVFGSIYGVDDVQNNICEEQYNTIHKADLQREVKSLISYAVGCMFGRYSLDYDGIAYAGGKWDETKYSTFIPDVDNVIPINDESYFEDDIIGLLCIWLKKVYGDDTFEANLDFLANAIGNKGDSSKSKLRNYFMNDFMNDHIRMYQKRPIYWLFDSGKENGFKCLIYLHRFNEDIVGKIRLDYLHKTQKAIEQAMNSAEYVKENASNGTDKANATKKITKYTKQLAELRVYDEAMAHIANQRISLDLDDGVKVNYEKFQGVEVAQEGKKALKIDLLAKIK